MIITIITILNKFTIKGEITDKIKDIKLKIQENNGTEIHAQKLVFAGNLLNDDKTLVDYGIIDENTAKIHLIIKSHTF